MNALLNPAHQVFQRGDCVRVWPGTRPGRSAVTLTTTGVVRLGDVPGVYVQAAKDKDGRSTPPGFYALSHVEPAVRLVEHARPWMKPYVDHSLFGLIGWDASTLHAEGWRLIRVDETGIGRYERTLSREDVLTGGPRCPKCNRASMTTLTTGRWECTATDWRDIGHCGWNGTREEVADHMATLMREVLHG